MKTPYTCAAANLTGHASNVTGAAFAITAASAGDGLAHKITVRNDSSTDHSGKTVTLTGKDLRGNDLTETLTGPGASATVTSAYFYASLSDADPSETIGDDTFDIGWTAAAVSPWLPVEKQACSVAVAVSGTTNYDVEHTYDLEMSGAVTAFKHSVLASQTASADGQYIAPVVAVRVNVNSHTAGGFTFYVAEGRK